MTNRKGRRQRTTSRGSQSDNSEDNHSMCCSASTAVSIPRSERSRFRDRRRQASSHPVRFWMCLSNLFIHVPTKTGRRGHLPVLCVDGRKRNPMVLNIDMQRLPRGPMALYDAVARRFQQIPEHQRTYEVCLAAVQEIGIAVGWVPRQHLTDELCLAALRQHPDALHYLGPDLRSREDICLAAVRHFGSALRFVPKHVVSLDICLEAVQHYDCIVGDVLCDVPDHLRITEVCFAAVERSVHELQRVPSRELSLELLRVGLRDCPPTMRPEAYLYRRFGNDQWLKRPNVQSLLQQYNEEKRLSLPCQRDAWLEALRPWMDVEALVREVMSFTDLGAQLALYNIPR